MEGVLSRASYRQLQRMAVALAGLSRNYAIVAVVGTDSDPSRCQYARSLFHNAFAYALMKVACVTDPPDHEHFRRWDSLVVLEVI